jgi:hypothetical protein
VRRALERVAVADRRAVLRLRVAAAFWPAAEAFWPVVVGFRAAVVGFREVVVAGC